MAQMYTPSVLDRRPAWSFDLFQRSSELLGAVLCPVGELLRNVHDILGLRLVDSSRGNMSLYWV